MERFSPQNFDEIPNSEENPRVKSKSTHSRKVYTSKPKKYAEKKGLSPLKAKEKGVREVVKLFKDHTTLFNERQAYRKKGKSDSLPEVKKIKQRDNEVENRLENYPDDVISVAQKARRMGIAAHDKKVIRAKNLKTNAIFQETNPLPETKPQKLRKRVDLIKEAQEKLASLDKEPLPTTAIEVRSEEKPEVEDPIHKEVHATFLKAVAKGEVEGYRHAHTYLDQADAVRKMSVTAGAAEKIAFEEEAERLVKQSETEYDRAEKEFKDREYARMKNPELVASIQNLAETIEEKGPVAEIAPTSVGTEPTYNPPVAKTPFVASEPLHSASIDTASESSEMEETEVSKPRQGMFSRIKNLGHTAWQRMTDVINEQRTKYYQSRGLIENEEEEEFEQAPLPMTIRRVETEKQPADVVFVESTPHAITEENNQEFLVGWEGDWGMGERPEGYEDIEPLFESAKKRGFNVHQALGEDFLTSYIHMVNAAEKGSLTTNELSELLAKNTQFYEALLSFKREYKAAHPPKPRKALPSSETPLADKLASESPIGEPIVSENSTESEAA